MSKWGYYTFGVSLLTIALVVSTFWNFNHADIEYWPLFVAGGIILSFCGVWGIILCVVHWEVAHKRHEQFARRDLYGRKL